MVGVKIKGIINIAHRSPVRAKVIVMRLFELIPAEYSGAKI